MNAPPMPILPSSPSLLPISHLSLHIPFPCALSRKHAHQPHSQTLRINRITYLKEEPNNEHLQPSHTHHHQTLNDREIEDPSLCASDRAEIAVLACAEILLVAGDGGELAGELED